MVGAWMMQTLVDAKLESLFMVVFFYRIDFTGRVGPYPSGLSIGTRQAPGTNP